MPKSRTNRLWGQPWAAYDGSFFYWIHKRQIKTTEVDSSGVKKLIRNLSDLTYLRMLHYNRPVFDIKKYKSVLIDTIRMQGYQALEVTVLDSFENRLKIMPKDPAMAITKVIYEVSLPDYSLRKRTEWIYIMATPQYTENVLSQIRPLPDSVTFEKVFNLDALLKSGYTLNNSIPSVQPSVTSLIAAGAFFPKNIERLSTADSSLFRLDDVKEGVILMDFWYRSCFPCLKALPAIESLHQQYRSRGLTVLGMNSHDKDFAKLKKFLAEREVTYPTLMNTDKSLPASLGISGYPCILLVDAATKKVLHVQEGYSDATEAELAGLIETYLN